MVRVLSAFILAVVATYVVATIVVSQANIGSVIAHGMPVSVAMRAQAALHDVLHMYDLYLPLITVGLLLALVAARLAERYVLELPQLLYPLAGFVALMTIHVALKGAFDVWAVAPARTPAGLLGQALAGAFGGCVFYLASRRLQRAAA